MRRGARIEPHYRIDNRQRRQFTAAEDVITKADFERFEAVDNPLVETLVMPGDQQQAFLARQFLDQVLVQCFSLRRKQDSRGRPRVLFLDVFDGVENRLAHHDHSRSAAEGLVVHGLVGVGSEIADIGHIVLNQPLICAPLGDAGGQDRGDHFGEKGQDVDAVSHRIVRQLAAW